MAQSNMATADLSRDEVSLRASTLRSSRAKIRFLSYLNGRVCAVRTKRVAVLPTLLLKLELLCNNLFFTINTKIYHRFMKIYKQLEISKL